MKVYVHIIKIFEGQNLAMVELQVILANLLRRYHFFVNPSAPEVLPLHDVTLNPNAPVNLVVSKRQSAF